jgi:hypothetical protein
MMTPVVIGAPLPSAKPMNRRPLAALFHFEIEFQFEKDSENYSRTQLNRAIETAGTASAPGAAVPF